MLRNANKVLRQAWIACITWERMQYERSHPESALPGHRIPVSEALRITESCLNPVGFVTDDLPAP